MFDTNFVSVDAHLSPLNTRAGLHLDVLVVEHKKDQWAALQVLMTYVIQ